MIINLIKSLFSRDTSRTLESYGVEELVALLQDVASGTGEYAVYASQEDNFRKRSEKGQEMLSVITSVEERCDALSDSKLYYLLAIAYRNYCAWFIRGDQRKEYLEKCISLLEKSASSSPENVSAKSELGRLLIEEKVIRDLPRGIELLEELEGEGEMPSYLNSVLAKAQRQSGSIEMKRRYDLCQFDDPSPAVFEEERKKFRALIRKYKGQDEIEKLKIVLNQYYNLAVLVTLCYGDHDCSSGVTGRQYDEAIDTVKDFCDKINFSFESKGFIEKSSFISRNDWRNFARAFGESNKKFDPVRELLGR